ncbi:MAG TPA: MBL fold metallo-hydrolase [Caulobacteraceae bacterium]|nr:MBL fold metallo-hydrolase [Caulobacteraceae bacterium]
MHTSFARVAVLAAALWWGHAAAATRAPTEAVTPQSTALQAAKLALGADTVKSLEFSAVGTRFTFSQPIWTGFPNSPARTIKSYRADFDFTTGGVRVESELTTAATAGVYVGDQHTIESFADQYAWSEQTPPLGRGGDATILKAQPQPDAVDDRTFWLWAATPQGVLKAASGGEIHKISGGVEVSFDIGRHYHATARINDLNQVESVRTLVADPVLGDTILQVNYAGYRDFDGLQFPSLITEFQAGEPLVQLAVTQVKANPELSIKVPDSVKTYSGPTPLSTIKSRQIANGVYWITGVAHHSMAVDMGRYIIVVEAPLAEERSLAVIAEAKRLMPGKPIRYVVNTHVHFDHSGGLRTYVAQGATVITQAANIDFYKKAWARPRSLEPDLLSRSRRRPRFLAVGDQATVKGSNGRVLELVHLQGNPHDESSLVAWLPAERILFQSDIIDGPGEASSPVVANFHDNLRRLNIEPLQIVGGHGSRILTGADLRPAAATEGPTP